MLASSDQRYLKLVRFLLDGKGIEVVATVPLNGVADAVGGEDADVAVIDTDALGEGLRLANITRARRPETAVVLVGDNTARAPAGRAPDVPEVGRHGRASSPRSRMRSSREDKAKEYDTGRGIERRGGTEVRRGGAAVGPA